MGGASVVVRRGTCCGDASQGSRTQMSTGVEEFIQVSIRKNWVRPPSLLDVESKAFCIWPSLIYGLAAGMNCLKPRRIDKPIWVRIVQ
jgi:hypothetical protein